jgi:hypothetical protein
VGTNIEKQGTTVTKKKRKEKKNYIRNLKNKETNTKQNVT